MNLYVWKVFAGRLTFYLLQNTRPQNIMIKYDFFSNEPAEKMRNCRHQCEQCAYQTNDSGNFKRHVRLKHTDFVATAMVELECTYCSFRTKWRGSLDKHIRQTME